MKIVKVEKTEAGTGEITMEYAEQTFKELLAFQGYGFCKAHATSYSVYSAVQMWLQEHYFIEYMCALLNHIDRAKEKKGVGILNERVEYCMKYGRTILYPDVNRSGDKWVIVNNNDTLLAPLKNIKGFSDREVGIIERNRPYSNLKDFLDKTKFNKNRFEALLFAHALDSFGEIEDLYNWYYNHYVEQEKQENKNKKQKMEQSFLWDDADNEQPSTVPENIRTFTKNEIEERCLDMNGFVIHENIRIKYNEFFERGMEKVAEFKKNPAYNSPRRRIYKLSEIECEEPEEDKFKNRWVLAKITSEARDIPSKFGGKTFHKITINDGFSSVTITGNRIPRSLSKGRVMVFPVSIINGKMYIDNHAMEKLDPVVLEEGE